MVGASKTDLIQQLTEGIAALTTTQEWERWLRAQHDGFVLCFGSAEREPWYTKARCVVSGLCIAQPFKTGE